MRSWSRFSLIGALVLSALMGGLSGCVVHEHDRDASHDASYAQGYKEGYYDREHNRYWHDQKWHDCVEHDVHCG